MRPALLAFLFWLTAIWFEPIISSIFYWFRPNLLFLFPILFCLHWRGHETIFISVIFGLTADSFSSLPFGTIGLTYVFFSIFLRWYAVKIYQESMMILPIVTAIFTLAMNVLILLILLLLFSEKHLSVGWLMDLIVYEVLPTAILAVPFFKLFTLIESKLQIRLVERKF